MKRFKENVLLTIACLFYPIMCNAAESGSPSNPANSFNSLLTLAIIIIPIIRRKEAMGGWLLFFALNFYKGILITLILFFSTIEQYSASYWGNHKDLFMYLLTTIPGYIVLFLQAIVVTALLKSNNWKWIVFIRWLLIGSIINSCLTIPIDLWYFKSNIMLQIIALLYSVIWVTYFIRSKRIIKVFKDHNWNQQQLTFSPSVE